MRVRMDKTVREHGEDGQMNMSSRLTDMRVRMDMTHGLRKSTVRMDK